MASSGCVFHAVLPTRPLSSLHRVPRVGSPAPSVPFRGSDSLTPFPPHFVASAWRYLCCALSPVLTAALGRFRCGEGPSLIRFFSRGDVRVSQVPGGPPIPTRPALRPRWPSEPRHFVPSVLPSALCTTWAISTTTFFRGAITRLTGSLSTLRSPGYPGSTQDSLPAGG